MADDPMVTAARAVDDLEARILTRFAAGETLNDIAINLEISKVTVKQTTDGKGKSNRQYALNLIRKRNELRESIGRGGTPIPAIAMHDGHDVIGPGPRASMLAPSPPAPARRPALPDVLRHRPQVAVPPPAKRGSTTVKKTAPTKKAAPVKKVAAPELTPVDLDAVLATTPEPEQPEQPVAVTNVEKEPEPPVTPTTPADETEKTTTIPAPRAADLPLGEPDPVPVDADAIDPGGIGGEDDHEPSLPDKLDDLLQLAETLPDEKVQELLAEKDALIQRIREAVAGVERRAGALRRQISSLDSQLDDMTKLMAEKQARRAELAEELRKLFAGDVTVTAASGHLRPRS
jgi:hypothetical protein